MIHFIKEFGVGTILLLGMLVGLDLAPGELMRWEQLTVGVAAVVAVVLITKSMTKTMVELRKQSSDQMHEMLELMTLSQEHLAASLKSIAEQLARLTLNLERVGEDLEQVETGIAKMRYEQERHQYTYKHDRKLVEE